MKTNAFMLKRLISENSLSNVSFVLVNVAAF